jgi:hypothetical protein
MVWNYIKKNSPEVMNDISNEFEAAKHQDEGETILKQLEPEPQTPPKKK